MHESLTEHNRGRRFKVALAHRETTAKAWAAEHGVTRGHLHKVLAGERESVSLLREIDAFIGEVERQVARSLTAAA